jgi:DNA gyrase subunit A
LEREKIDAEYADLMDQIQHFNAILADENLVLEIIRDELLVIRDKFGDKRRSEITAAADEIDLEDLIEEEEVVVTLTHFGYVKRLPTDAYKTQRRGGRGVTGMTTREEDFVERLLTTSTHNFVLFFTSKGRVFRLKAYEIPEVGRQAKGTAIVNLLELAPGEQVTAAIPIKDFEEGKFLFFGTRNGVVKKTDLLSYNTARKGGLIAIVLEDDDELINVKLTDGGADVLLNTYRGMAIRFHESDVRPMGRVSHGVRGVRLAAGDYVVGVSAARENGDLLVVTENGYVKQTGLSEYNVQRRGGQGVKTYHITETTGAVVGVKVVTDKDDLMLITSDGTIIRMKTREIRQIGRRTSGARLMRCDEGVQVASVARTEEAEEEEESGAETANIIEGEGGVKKGEEHENE